MQPGGDSMHRTFSASLTIVLVGALVVVPALFMGGAGARAEKDKAEAFIGVCPPFFIRDEGGIPINPVKGENAAVPYSPRQTCGAAGCHDYEKITKAYHFQQGKDEEAGRELKSLYQWVLSPGQYGGRW